jgi:hypothetical protein
LGTYAPSILIYVGGLCPLRASCFDRMIFLCSPTYAFRFAPFLASLMPSPSSAYISAHSSSLSVTSPGRTSKSRYTCSSAKIDGSSYLLAWLIIGVLVNNFVIAPFFFFWWHQAAWHRVAAVRELNELEVTQRAWEVESHIQLGDRLVVLAFKVGEASLRAVAVRQLKDVVAAWRTREGDWQ